mgnify:CR=1 FL=1
MPDETSQGDDLDAQAILDSVTGDSAPADSTGDHVEGAPDPARTPEETAQELFAEVAGQKFKTKEDLVRFTERIFNRHSQTSREYANERKRFMARCVPFPN